jgi:Holliday junction resolvase RusA-like endonuclease
MANVDKVVVWIPGTMPGMNEILTAKEQSGKCRRNAYTKMKKDWTGYVERIFRECKLEPAERVSLNIVWHEPDRRRDKDNISAGKKFLFDGMVKAGVIKNDGWDQIAGWTESHVVNKFTCGVDVTINYLRKGKRNRDKA